MYESGAPVGVTVAAGGAVLTATNAPVAIAAALAVVALIGGLFLLRVVHGRRARKEDA